MAPPKRKKGKKAAAEATATATKKKGKGRKAQAEVEDDEDEDDEDKPKSRGRAAKDYGVTGADIAQMREDGQSWQEIQDEVGAKSAIPLRNLMNKYLAEQDEDQQIDPDDGDAIVEARDEQALGWGQIAARSGLTVAEVKKAYVEAGGENVDKRAYRSKDGTVHFGGGNGAKADADDEDTESEYDDMDRAALTSELQERGLSTKGKTSVLRSRLVENDAEQEDEDEPEPEPAPKKKKGKKGAKAGR